MRVRDLLLLALLFVGIAYMYIISKQGSMVGYVAPVTIEIQETPGGISGLSGKSNNLVAEVFYYSYQRDSLSQLFQYLNYFRYIVKEYDVNSSVGRQVFNGYATTYNIPEGLMPLVKIGKLIFYVEPSYINLASCPSDTEYVYIGNRLVELCKVEDRVYLLTYNSLYSVTEACKVEKAPVCYG